MTQSPAPKPGNKFKVEHGAEAGSALRDTASKPDSMADTGTETSPARSAGSVETLNASAANEGGMISEGDIQNSRSSSLQKDGNR